MKEGLRLSKNNISVLSKIPLHADLQSYVKRNFRRAEDEVYVPVSKVSYHDKLGHLKKLKVGINSYMKKEKVIMLVGATGSGKSTTINAMFNYILGVDFENKFRVRLVEEKATDQTQSITKEITAYSVYYQHGFKVQNSLTIIDTPGFGDPAGIIEDRAIKSKIETFFRTKGENGIEVLDAVIFVVPSNNMRLTPHQRYIFDEVLSIFGKDIKDNIFLFCTFCDNPKRVPKAVDTLEKAKIPYSKIYFKFNMGDLYNMEHACEFNKGYWKLGAKNFEDFFKELNKTQAKSLQLTKDVMKKRTQLEDTLINVQDNIMIELNELQKLDKEREILRKYEQDMERNKNFTYEVSEQFVEVQPLEEMMVAINCQICYVTCLKTTYQWKDSSLRDCWLFEKDPVGCTRCPNECQFSSHRCETVLYEITAKKVTKTLENLKREYEEAMGRKLSAEQIVKECTDRVERIRGQTVTFIQQARGCIERLNAIALKPESISTADYIDLMIQAERDRSGEDQVQRVQMLMQIKERAKVTRAIMQGNDQAVLPRSGSSHRGIIQPEIFKTNMNHVVDVRKGRRGSGGFLGKLRIK